MYVWSIECGFESSLNILSHVFSENGWVRRAPQHSNIHSDEGRILASIYRTAGRNPYYLLRVNQFWLAEVLDTLDLARGRFHVALALNPDRTQVRYELANEPPLSWLDLDPSAWRIEDVCAPDRIERLRAHSQGAPQQPESASTNAG